MITETSSPATEWVDGHILGNGDLGVVVWGPPDNPRFGLSKHDVNDLRRNHIVEDSAIGYQELVEKVLEGETGVLHGWGFERSNELSGPHQLACGELSFRFMGDQWCNFMRTLNMENAESLLKLQRSINSVNWAYQPGDLNIRSYVHAEMNCLVIELECSDKMDAFLKLTANLGMELPQKPVYRLFDDGSCSILQRLPEKQDCNIMLNIQGGMFEFEAGGAGISGTLSFGGKCGRARVIVTAVSLSDAGNADLQDASRKLLNEVLQSLKNLDASHRQWWKEFWEKSSVSCGNDDIARLWYMGVYALAASSRPDKSPPNLQGIWNLYNVPPWRCDFHFNTNVQMCQWIACRANHPELEEALIRKITVDWDKELQENASKIFGSAGVAFPVGSDWLGRAIGWGGLSLELCMTAWMAQHLWDHWRYTQDIGILEKSIFPFLKKCCEFYKGILRQRPDGLYHIELSHSPEQVVRDENNERYFGFGTDPAIDLVFLRILYGAVIEAAELLEEPEEDIEEWKYVLSHLPENPLKDGVLIDADKVFFHDGVRSGQFQLSHRHPSRLTPIFPGEEIGLHSPEEILNLGIRSFHEFRSYGDDNFTGWSMAWQAIIAARLGLTAETEQILNDLLKHFTLSGFLNSHNSLTGEYGMRGNRLFQIDGTIGAAAAVNEMLVQYGGGEIRIFPAFPDKYPAAFTNLRVPGGILVSAEKNKSGIQIVKIQNTAPSPADIILVNPWGECAVYIRSESASFSLEGKKLTWKVETGSSYSLTPCHIPG